MPAQDGPDGRLPERAAPACRCGHDRAAHEHYRPGRDCALCPDGACARYRPRRSWARLGRLRGGG